MTTQGQRPSSNCRRPGNLRAMAAAIVVVLAVVPLSVLAQSESPKPAPAAVVPEQSTLAKPAAGNDAAAPGYRIGAGDALQINVWKETEASVPSVVVRPDGKISLPLVKEVDVMGLMPAELEKVLTAKLARFIRDADVTVVVQQIHSKKVYLVGAVKKEGPVALLSSMTVLQVLSEAGGLSDYAKKRKIYVLRTENGKQVKHAFDYQAVIRGEHIEQNIPVLPDDIIVVPQ